MKRIIIVITTIVMIFITACSSQPELQPAVTATGNDAASQPAVEPTKSEPTVTDTESSIQMPQVIEPIYDEDDVRYISNISDRYSINTFDQLNSISEYVVTGTCISSKPVFRKDLLYTISEIQINGVYRGDTLTKGDIILVIEWGGRTTYGDYYENCHIEEKAFETGERMPSDMKLVAGLDGYFPLKEGEQVLLFLGDETGFIEEIKEPLFGIWGGYDGKLFLQPDGVTYAKPLPAQTDKLQFGEGTFTITADDLEKVKQTTATKTLAEIMADSSAGQ